MSKKNPHALIAQLDRAFGYGPKGWEFESLWVHHNRGIRTPRERNRIFGFFFFYAVFACAAVAVGVIGENQVQK